MKFLVSFLIVFSLNSFFNVNDDSFIEIYNDPSNIDNVSIRCESTKDKFLDVCEYNFVTASNILGISFSNNDYVKKYSINENKCSIFIFNLNDIAILNIKFIFNESKVGCYSLYFAKDKNEVFHSSTISIDSAKIAAGISVGYNFVEEKAKNKNSNVLKSNNSIGVTGSFCGNLRWYDPENNIHPLVGVKVKITINGVVGGVKKLILMKKDIIIFRIMIFGI